MDPLKCAVWAISLLATRAPMLFAASQWDDGASEEWSRFRGSPSFLTYVFRSTSFSSFVLIFRDVSHVFLLVPAPRATSGRAPGTLGASMSAKKTPKQPSSSRDKETDADHDVSRALAYLLPGTNCH